MDSYIFGNIAMNVALVGAVVWFGKRWMVGVERTANENRKDMFAHTEQTRTDLATLTAHTTEDLKTAIRENRDEHREKSKEIIDELKILSNHVAVANGRTSKLENKIAVQVALCEDRNKRDACQTIGE